MKNKVKHLATGIILAAALLIGNVEVKATELPILIFETEAALELENWMTSNNTWGFMNELDVEMESGLELEGWMTSEKAWEVQEKVVEEKLKVESWMTNPEDWK